MICVFASFHEMKLPFFQIHADSSTLIAIVILDYEMFLILYSPALFPKLRKFGIIIRNIRQI